MEGCAGWTAPTVDRSGCAPRTRRTNKQATIWNHTASESREDPDMANVQPVTDAAVTYGNQRETETRNELQPQIDDLTAQNAQLQEELDDCQSGGGPTPPEPNKALIGSSVNGSLFTNLGYSEADVTRVYLRSLPSGSKWNKIVNDGGATSDLKDGQANLAPGGALWLSWKEANVNLCDAFFDTIPEEVHEKYHIIGTWYHEPEDNETSSSQKQ